MSKQPDVIKQSDLLNQVVIDRNSMQELGQIEVLWMYPKVHRVLGFICRSGWLGAKKTAFNLDQLQTIGGNGVLVKSKPVETDAEKVRQLESLVNCEVWTDAGNKAGKVTDYLFNLQTGEIEHYLFASSGWGGIIGTIYLLPPNYILSFGNERVLVSEHAVRSFAIYREGIQDKFNKAASLLREEKTQVTQEVKSLFEQARERAQSIAEQAKERARSMADSWVDELEFDDPITATAPNPPTTSEADPWDDWEVEQPKEETKRSTQDSIGTEKKSHEKPVSDPWDDESWI